MHALKSSNEDSDPHQHPHQHPHPHQHQLSFVFEGCSWGCIYYIGVYEAILSSYSSAELSAARYGGSSSGTLAALGMCLGKSVQECKQLYAELANCGEEFGVFGLMSVYHEIVLRRWLPQDGDQYKSLRGRLYVNVTRFVATSEVISDWTSNDDLIHALHASMHIPFYMSYIKSVRGSWGLDGGLSANIFRIDEKSITISAATRKGDVYPTILLSPVECFQPPSKQRREEIFNDGSRAPLLTITNNRKAAAAVEWSSSSTSSSSLASRSPNWTMKKVKTELVRYALCSIFWPLRALEGRVYTVCLICTSLLAVHRYVPLSSYTTTGMMSMGGVSKSLTSFLYRSLPV